jgi:hypothetical protein
MAKKQPSRHAVESMLKLIKDRLSLAQQAELMEILIDEWEYVSGMPAALAGAEIKERSLKARIADLKELLSRMEKELKQTRADRDNRIRKRPMSPGRIETAKAYLRLREKYPKLRAAILALIDLPPEQGKGYVQRYRDTNDMRQLESYLRSLLAVYRKHRPVT